MAVHQVKFLASFQRRAHRSTTTRQTIIVIETSTIVGLFTGQSKNANARNFVFLATNGASSPLGGVGHELDTYFALGCEGSHSHNKSRIVLFSGYLQAGHVNQSLVRLRGMNLAYRQ